VFEVLMILTALAMFCLITRLWPLLFLVVPGIIIAALRLLYVSAKKGTAVPASAEALPEPPRQDTEQDVARIAFGILQRRITEHVVSRYPAARWVWEVPNAIERLTEGLPLTILLNRAGGFRKAMVQVHNLQFCGLAYETAGAGRPDEPPPEIDIDGDTGCEDTSYPGDTVDYALVAFQWVEANLLALNNRCNDSIAVGKPSLLIPACDLPHTDSWQDICSELTRNGFTETVVQTDGICVSIPE
jgi:hypothetical protein